MTERPWLPLYVADYLADTAHLSAAEHGAYLLLIMHYWRVGKLPNDERQLQRIARMTPREWANSRDVLAEFFDAEWRHKRIESEILKSDLKANARAEAGSRGGKAKALKNNKAGLANATVLPEQNTKQKPSKTLPSSSEFTSASSLRSEAEPRARDLNAVLCEAAGITDATKTAGLLSLSEPHAWLHQGCDLDLDILPTLRAIAARGKQFRAWTYCSKAVLEARDNRLSGSIARVGATTASAVAARPHRNSKIIEALGRIAEHGLDSFKD
jgi:uncharacterized protein YdaU (DUF1376 family)